MHAQEHIHVFGLSNLLTMSLVILPLFSQVHIYIVQHSHSYITGCNVNMHSVNASYEIGEMKVSLIGWNPIFL